MGKFCGCFTLIVVLYMAVPANSQIGKRCTMKELYTCLEDAVLETAWYPENETPLQVLKRYCSTQESRFFGCIDQVSLACKIHSDVHINTVASVRLATRLMTDAARIICAEETIEGFQKYEKCFAKRALGVNMAVCNFRFQSRQYEKLKTLELCEPMTTLVNCLTRKVEQICNKEAAIFVKNSAINFLDTVLGDMLKLLGMPCTFDDPPYKQHLTSEERNEL